jgi:hypothetical protein
MMVPEIHARIEHAAIDQMVCKAAEGQRRELRKLRLRHLAGSHEEFPVTYSAKSTDVAGNPDIVGRVGEDQASLVSRH